MLLPLDDAWVDLKATAGQGDYPAASPAGAAVSRADVRYLAALLPGEPGPG